MRASSACTPLDGTRPTAPLFPWVVLGVALALLAAGPASAQQEPAPTEAPPSPAVPPSSAAQPLLFHVPPTSVGAGAPLEVTATLTESWQLRTLSLAYRRLDRDGWHAVPFRQVSTGDFAAVVPGDEVASPAIEYYVESVDREGRTRRHFASPERPHRVEVIGLTSAQEERIEEDRFGGARHRFAARSEWSDFGDRSVAGWMPEARRPGYTEAQLRPRTDDFVEFHADYAYRLLGIVESIHFGFGIVRGHAPRLDYESDVGSRPADQRAPGFNYGWSGLAFRFHRYFGMGVDVYLGATQYGFDGGGGGFFRIGHTAETHFDLGVDYVSNLGYRAWATFEWDTVPYVPMSLTAEFTDWPDPGDDAGDGVRLWYGASAHVWQGLILSARVGYAARHGSNTGGPIVGGGVAYEF
ncbi:MAG: hypothetical protein JXB32_13140 [Deltaproteobacteria bacterium]|nr:hypothetical protein [Deltaproteobacteria bacterium]